MQRPRFADRLEDVQLNLPAGKRLATVLAVTYAPDGSLYILHQGHPPVATLSNEVMASLLPQIVHVTANGDFLDAWGGPDHVAPVDGVSQWPAGVEGLECDADGNLWLFGFVKDDDAVLKVSPSGELLLRIGQRADCRGDGDTTRLGGPTSCYHDTKTREVFVADGYVNHRVISFNSDTGAFIRMWGANGKDPATLSAEEGYGNPVHKVVLTPTGNLLVCDRIKNRVQEFELLEQGVRFVREVVIAPGTGGFGSAFDIGFVPGSDIFLVADGTNGRIWSVDYTTFQVLGWSNALPSTEGDDNLPNSNGFLHRFTVEPSGDLLLACTGGGVKRLRYLGIR